MPPSSLPGGLKRKALSPAALAGEHGGSSQEGGAQGRAAPDAPGFSRPLPTVYSRATADRGQLCFGGKESHPTVNSGYKQNGL